MGALIKVKTFLFALLVFLSFSINNKAQTTDLLVPYFDGMVWGFANTQGEVVIECKYYELEPFEDGIAKFAGVVGNPTLNGFINKKGVVVSSIESQDNRTAYITNHREGISSIKSIGKPYQIFNSDGIEIYSGRNTVGKFNKGIAPIQFGNLEWGFIDKHGKIIVNFKDMEISKIEDFNGDYALVTFWSLPKGFKEETPGKTTLVDHKGKFPIKKTFAGLTYSDNVFKCSGVGEGRFLDKSGKLLFSFSSVNIGKFYNGRALVNGMKYGFASKNGKEVIKSKFEKALPFIEKITAAKENGKWYFIDLNGKEINTNRYEEVRNPSEGFFAVKDSAWGFVNNKGVLVAETQYNKCDGCQDGMAAVMMDDKWGFINTKGELIIPPKYSYVQSFNNGISKVTTMDRKIGYIDKLGNEYWKDGSFNNSPNN